MDSSAARSAGSLRLLTMIAIVALSLLPIACSNYGKKLAFGKGELFYTENVQKAEAQRLGNYLLKSGYFDDEKEKSVQLEKAGDLYQVRLVMKDGAEEDTTTVRQVKSFGAAISRHVFDGKKIELHICDDYFETKKVVPPANFGKRMEFKGGDLFYLPPITEEQATALGNFLVEGEFFDGQPKSVQFARQADAYLFRVVLADEKTATDSTYINLFRQVGTEISQGVVDNAPVIVHLCDDNFETIQVVEPETILQ